MNLNPEIKKIEELKNKDRKVPVTMMITPEILRMIDESSQLMRLARGDFLSACFLRVLSSYKNGDTVKIVAADNGGEFDAAAHAKKIWGNAE